MKMQSSLTRSAIIILVSAVQSILEVASNNYRVHLHGTLNITRGAKKMICNNFKTHGLTLVMYVNFSWMCLKVL